MPSRRRRGNSVDRLINTYSIIARDPDTGQLGVAVQSHWFAVGQVVPWAESGVGAVATQAFVDASYGPRGLAMMRAGAAAPDALAALVAADSRRDVRQVAMVDAHGRVAAHTGALTIAEAGHFVGDQFSVQANMMLKNTVWPAMAEAFRSANGDLAERLLRALEAAEAEGGDIRGMQSAAILVVQRTPSTEPWNDRIFDLRVDDHPKPLVELRRLIQVCRAYHHRSRAQSALARGEFGAAESDYDIAERLIGDNPEMHFWHGIDLINAGRLDDAKPHLSHAFARDQNWLELALRLPRAQLLGDDPELVRAITTLAFAHKR